MNSILIGKENKVMNNSTLCVNGAILIGYAGSIAYGTNTPTSDVDIRGIVENTEAELLGLAKDRETISVPGEDTILYTLKKALSLFSQCNPNVIEMLGLKQEHYLNITEAGQEILKNKSIFLSNRAVHTFGSYAKSQLNRLTNKSVHNEQDLQENEKRSTKKVLETLMKRYNFTGNVFLQNGEIRVSLDSTTLPLSDLSNVLNELNNVRRDYEQRSKRNDYAAARGKLAKHQMHLLRLYIMGIDILNGEIITYREKEHNLLMAIRNGQFLKNDKPTDEFMSLLANYERKFNEAARNSKLPEKANMDKINALAIRLNRKILEA